MSRETIIKSTIAGSLAWKETQEMPVDRVTALAIGTLGNDLGAVIAHAEAMDVQSMRKVVLLVARRLNHSLRLERGFAERIAIAALREFIDSKCPVCGGRGALQHENQVVVASCTACDATGLHRYSDGERRAMLGSKLPRKGYDEAYRIIADSMASAVRGANTMLDK